MNPSTRRCFPVFLRTPGKSGQGKMSGEKCLSFQINWFTLIFTLQTPVRQALGEPQLRQNLITSPTASTSLTEHQPLLAASSRVPTRLRTFCFRACAQRQGRQRSATSRFSGNARRYSPRDEIRPRERGCCRNQGPWKGMWGPVWCR